MKIYPIHDIQIIKELVISDFKLRYQNSYLGYLWTLFKPLMLFGVMYLVFSVFMRSNVPYYPVYLLLGVLIWNYFSEATLVGMNTFLTKRDLVTKINFNRSTLVIASTISSTITLLLNFVIFFVFLLISGIQPSFEYGFFFIYLIELYFITTGFTFLLASLLLYFRDLQHIWEILLQIGFWLTPIVYSLSIVPSEYHHFVMMNPLARVIEYSRALFINHSILPFSSNLVLLVMAIVSFSIGYLVFRSQAAKIAEKI